MVRMQIRHNIQHYSYRLLTFDLLYGMCETWRNHFSGRSWFEKFKYFGVLLEKFSITPQVCILQIWSDRPAIGVLFLQATTLLEKMFFDLSVYGHSEFRTKLLVVFRLEMCQKYDTSKWKNSTRDEPKVESVLVNRSFASKVLEVEMATSVPFKRTKILKIGAGLSKLQHCIRPIFYQRKAIGYFGGTSLSVRHNIC